jgi:hypothetical protein
MDASRPRVEPGQAKRRFATAAEDAPARLLCPWRSSRWVAHARKAGIKYRYYLSSALLNGAAERAGSVARVPAAGLEAVVVKSVREHVRSQRAIDDRTLIETHVVRVEVHTDHVTIKLAQAESEADDTPPSLPRLPAAAAGSMSSLAIRGLVRKALPSASSAASET